MRTMADGFHIVSRLLALGAALLAVPASSFAADAVMSSPNEQVMAALSGKGNSHRAVRLRVESVGYRLAMANADRCDVPDRMTGLILHDLASYDRAVRPAVMERFGLGQGFGVLDVVPGSAADRAGFRAGDEIITLGAIDLASFETELMAKSATSDRVEGMRAVLEKQLEAGSVTLSVKRGGGLVGLALGSDAGCGGRIAYMPSGPVNAWSDGRYVAITKAMIDFSRNDDELAFVIAHEMSHNLLHHARMLTNTSPVLAMFGIGSCRIKRTEVAADSLAVDLLLRASFDPLHAEALFHRTTLADLLDLGMTHPMGARRIQIIEEKMRQAKSTDLATMLKFEVRAAQELGIQAASAVPGKQTGT